MTLTANHYRILLNWVGLLSVGIMIVKNFFLPENVRVVEHYPATVKTAQ